MARARNIKPAFFMNEDLVELPFETRLIFIGLWTLADREGRLEDRHKRIRAQLMPYDNVDVDVCLSQLASAGMIIRYQHEDKNYIQVTKFSKHQNPHYKEVPSEIPPPPGVENSQVIAPATNRAQRESILKRDGHKCQSCGSTERLQIDHIIPKSKGGLSTEDNLQVLCIRCNASKGNRDSSASVESKSVNDRPTSANDQPTLSRVRYENPADSLNPITDSLNPLPPTPIKASAKPTGEVDSRFDEFWKSYPRNESKQAAVKAFKKINWGKVDFQSVMASLEVQKKSTQWTKDGGQFIPHGATWLNGAKWEDELPTAPHSPQPQNLQTTGDEHRNDDSYWLGDYAHLAKTTGD